MQKKVFISYSWGNKEHQDWIVNLGTRLMNDTVDVVLDRWSLKDGHDIHSFMEEMVKSEDIFRVLIICNRKYKEKADVREGGVGTETQIITPSIYSNQKQEKFIPIILERDEDGNPYLPIYLSSRKYIDFSRDENFEDSYEELLRNILEAPALPKPKLGSKPPVYITDSSINLTEANSKVKAIENQYKKTSQVPSRYIVDFLEVYQENLWTFEMKNHPNRIDEFGDSLIEQLKLYKPLREDFIKFIDLVSSIESRVESDDIIEFFETKPIYERPREDTGSWSPARFDIFGIIFQELFLYTVATCLKNKNYRLAEDLLHSKYYLKERYSRGKEPRNFTFLCGYHEYLEKYMSNKYNKITGFGDYLIKNLSESVSKEIFILADVLCYVVSYLDKKESYKSWFPTTYLYLQDEKIVFFDKISSKKHFDKIKGLLGVKDEEELKSKLLELKNKSEDRIRYSRGFESIPHIHELIDLEVISSYR